MRNIISSITSVRKSVRKTTVLLLSVALLALSIGICSTDSAFADSITSINESLAHNASLFNTKSVALASAAKPKTPSIKKLKSPSEGRISIIIGRLKGSTKYQIRYSKYEDMSKGVTVKTYKTKSNSANLTFNRLSKNKKYYVQVRSIKKTGEKAKFSSWSKPASVRVKCSHKWAADYVSEIYYKCGHCGKDYSWYGFMVHRQNLYSSYRYSPSYSTRSELVFNGYACTKCKKQYK